MRLRHIKGAEEEMLQSPYVVQDPETRKGTWKEEVFHRDCPLYLEIGMGKGRFIMDLATANTDINYIGIEKYSSVLHMALKKRAEAELENLWFLRAEAEYIADMFEQGEVDRIYLNFSDPWPKDRHAKRRLTSREFLARYEQVLAPEGRVEFKTDNTALFEFSLKEAEEAGWIIEACTFDLHHDAEMNEGNVMTEYEEKFSSQGNPIHKMIIRPVAAKAEKKP